MLEKELQAGRNLVLDIIQELAKEKGRLITVHWHSDVDFDRHMCSLVVNDGHLIEKFTWEELSDSPRHRAVQTKLKSRIRRLVETL